MKIDILVIANVVGLIGVAITLLAYLLLNARILHPRQWSYSAINALGSVFIMFSLCYEWNLSAWVMELSWLLVSLYGIYQALRSRPTHKRID